MASWGYLDHNGPSKWHEEFPIAKDGVRQSPIDIVSEEAAADEGLNALTWKYATEDLKDIENTGSSFKINSEGDGSELKGGPLDGSYQLWQFHAHWGGDNSKGSEHTVDGESFAAELHLVHWNNSKYSSPSEACGKPDGLAVVGRFIKVGEDPHEELEKILAYFDRIKCRADKVDLDSSVDPGKLLPENAEDVGFWTYDGSLTTPPLAECVIWLVLKEPLVVSQEQLDKMRSLLVCDRCEFEECGGDIDNDKKMIDNFRPPCPKGERKLRTFK